MTDHTRSQPQSVRFWFDTEFIESGPTSPIHLLSIGIVCDADDALYVEVSDAPKHKASEWVKANVLTQMHGDGIPLHEVGPAILQWVNSHLKEGQRPEFWAYYADYDWVLLCQSFGTMMDLPIGWPMFCMDIKQWAVQLGDPELPKQTSTGHHALADAEWTRLAWQFLQAAQT